MEAASDRRQRLCWWLGIAALALLCGGCASHAFGTAKGRSAETESFGYRSWVTGDPDVVLIGIHGFRGAAGDYDNLGKYLLAHQPRTGLYAYELRGQGSDPVRERRGDIGHPREWSRDLEAFTGHVRRKHPRAKVVWFGESMGGLIAAHSYRSRSGAPPPCDALVLSSPVVAFRQDFPRWKRALVQIAATAAPSARVSLDSFTNGQDVQVSAGGGDLAQSETNPYHIERHTLRLLAALARYIDGMPACAETFRVPVLVLHGEHDFFNNDREMRTFVSRIPVRTPVAHFSYSGAFHLLMYDPRRADVFRDVAEWLDGLRRSGFTVAP